MLSAKRVLNLVFYHTFLVNRWSTLTTLFSWCHCDNMYAKYEMNILCMRHKKQQPKILRHIWYIQFGNLQIDINDISRIRRWYFNVTDRFGCILIWKRSYWSFLHSHRIQICNFIINNRRFSWSQSLHFAHMAVKVESCDPVIAWPRLRGLVTSLMMGEVVFTVFRLGTCLPRPSLHVSEVSGHVRDVTRGQALRELTNERRVLGVLTNEGRVLPSSWSGIGCHCPHIRPTETGSSPPHVRGNTWTRSDEN